MYAVTVVSLGPGSREHLTLGVLETIRKARKLILRTAETDAGKYIAEQGIAFEALDGLHEEAEDFDEFTAMAVAAVEKAAKRGKTVYAVLDAVNDTTVTALKEKYPDLVSIQGGMPVAAPLLQAAGAAMPVRIAAATGLEVTDTQGGLMVTEINTSMLAGECKLKLTPWYGDETEVLFFPPSSKAAREAVRIPLWEIDRQKKYDHTAAVYIPPMKPEQRERHDFYDLVRIMDRLRGENGCPWDRQQTHETLARYLIEEGYEVSQAVNEQDWDHVADELGDVLLQVVFQANIGSQYGTFELSDVTSGIVNKMVRRHEHIFGDIKCDTPDEVFLSWEKIKQKERGGSTFADTLSSVSLSLPSLLRAQKVLKKLEKNGYDTYAMIQKTGCAELLTAMEDMRRQGLCPEERLQLAVTELVRQVENEEKT